MFLMKKLNKSTFSTGGEAICIGTVAVYAAYTMFPDMFWGLMVGMLPWVCGLSLLAYVFLKLDLEG